MSDRPCNYCGYESLKRSKVKGTKIVKKPAEGKLGGVNIYRKPISEELNHQKHFVVWYMELPNQCAC